MCFSLSPEHFLKLFLNFRTDWIRSFFLQELRAAMAGWPEPMSHRGAQKTHPSPDLSEVKPAWREQSCCSSMPRLENGSCLREGGREGASLQLCLTAVAQHVITDQLISGTVLFHLLVWVSFHMLELWCPDYSPTTTHMLAAAADYASVSQTESMCMFCNMFKDAPPQK